MNVPWLIPTVFGILVFRGGSGDGKVHGFFGKVHGFLIFAEGEKKKIGGFSPKAKKIGVHGGGLEKPRGLDRGGH